MLPLIYYKKGNISINKKKLNFKIISYLFIIIFLIVNATIYHHKIIKNEDISSSPSLIYGARIFFVFILGIFFLKEKITIKKIISLLLVLSGLFLFGTEK